MTVRVSSDHEPRPSRAVVAVLAAWLTLSVVPAWAEGTSKGNAPGDDSAPVFGREAGTGLDGSIGIAATAVLAVLGVGVLAAGRLRSPGGSGTLRVVGRAHLTGRHAVYLLRAGDRTLVLGVGPQGPPALLGELETPPEATAGPNPTGGKG
jgi:hypothetical protein